MRTAFGFDKPYLMLQNSARFLGDNFFDSGDIKNNLVENELYISDLYAHFVDPHKGSAEVHLCRDGI